jgi:alkylhydroperoxidase family enzyme
MTQDNTEQRHKTVLGQPPRIAPMEVTPDELGDVFKPPARYGDRPKPELMLMLRHNRAASQRFRPIPPEERSLAVRDQELAILRIAWLCQVPFIWGEHVRSGKGAGLTGEEIERIIVGSTAAGWADHDRALLGAAEELHGQAMISDETWATLAATLDEARLVELPLLIGQYQALGYVQNSLRVPLWPGNDGLAAR